MPFRLYVDIHPLTDFDQKFESVVKKALKDAARDLSAQSHAKIVEMVQQKLHSTREKYLDNLSYHQLDENTWVVELGKPALFIEDGLPPNFDMLPGLLKSKKAKTAKDGSKYVVVPFEHNKAKSRQTPAQKSLTDTIKAELKKQGAPNITAIEKGADGKPLLGMVRSFNTMNNPIKTGEGVGQGKGPVGAVKQGITGIPFLQGVRVFQKEVARKDGSKGVKKSVMTFRVASSKHAGERWIHPGLEEKHFFEKVAEWSVREFERIIWPSILDSMHAGL
jgi:hypothetical protein